MNIIYCALFLLIGSLYGEIIETSSFNEILKYVDQETLVILDIDDTLLLPVQTLGSDVWFRHHVTRLEEGGLVGREALLKAIQDWEAIRKVTHMKLVEPNIDQVVSQMQEAGIKIIGLTTQGLELSSRTISQLKGHNINLDKSAPHKIDFYFKNTRGCYYKHGILFTGGTDKGQALLKFLDHIDFHPDKFLFINDKESHLRDVEKDLEPLGHQFIGLRYNIGDERIRNFDPDLADYQWQYSTFHHLISDEEALLHLAR